VSANLAGEPRVRRRAARSCASVVMAIDQPRSAPTMRARGTCTSSKNTSLNQATPVISTSGRMVMPGDVMSTSRKVSPLCFGACASVRTIRMHQSAKRA
jgi:hypothetical protein